MSEKIEEILHLHFCRDTFLNSNDMPLLLAEFEANSYLKKIHGYVNPVTRFSKILRHFLIGLDLKTQEIILRRIKINGKFLIDDNSKVNAQFFLLQGKEIDITWNQFIYTYIEPLKTHYKCIFNSLDIDIDSIDTLDNDIKNLHEAFLFFSNYIYKVISDNFDLPLMQLKTLTYTHKDVTEVADKKNIINKLNDERVKQVNFKKTIKNEFKKGLRGFLNPSYAQKKLLIKKYNNDPTKILNRRYIISDLNFIDFLEKTDEIFIDLIGFDKVCTKHLKPVGDYKKNDNEMIHIGIERLLEMIFKQYAQENMSKYIVVQEFQREFDYSIFNDLAKKYNIHLLSSSINTWKSIDYLREKKIKKMNFIFGLDYLLEKYVK